jgi:hypothetical protein
MTWPRIGWCHQCQTFQRLEDAPRLRSPYAGVVVGSGEPGAAVPCCVACGADEPWGLGVWSAEGEDWPACTAEHAARQDSHYPGDCDCASLSGDGPTRPAGRASASAEGSASA